MHRKLDTMPTEAHFSERESSLDLQNLLHPARAFEHPRHVVNDPDLTLNEKRAILASWASDVCAVEAAPALRHAPGGAEPVRFDDVMDSLRDLDKHAKDQTNDAARYAASCGGDGS
jgi:hypothetical protein